MEVVPKLSTTALKHSLASTVSPDVVSTFTTVSTATSLQQTATSLASQYTISLDLGILVQYFFHLLQVTTQTFTKLQGFVFKCYYTDMKNFSGNFVQSSTIVWKFLASSILSGILGLLPQEHYDALVTVVHDTTIVSNRIQSIINAFLNTLVWIYHHQPLILWTLLVYWFLHKWIFRRGRKGRNHGKEHVTVNIVTQDTFTQTVSSPTPHISLYSLLSSFRALTSMFTSKNTKPVNYYFKPFDLKAQSTTNDILERFIPAVTSKLPKFQVENIYTALLRAIPDNSDPIIPYLEKHLHEIHNVTQLKRVLLQHKTSPSHLDNLIKEVKVHFVSQVQPVTTEMQLKKILSVMEHTYLLSFVECSEFLELLLTYGCFRDLKNKRQFRRYIHQHQDFNLFASHMLKLPSHVVSRMIPYRSTSNSSGTSQSLPTPRVARFHTNMDIVETLPHINLTFPNDTSKTSLIDTASTDSFISKELLDTMDVLTYTDPENPIRFVTSVHNTQIPEPNIRVNLTFTLPDYDDSILFSHNFSVIDTPGLFALGMDFIAKHSLDVNKLLVAATSSESSESNYSVLNAPELIEKHFKPLINMDEPSLPPHSPFDYSIELTSPLDTIKPRPLIKMSLENQQFLQEEVQRLLANGFISQVPPTTHYSVPFVVNGKLKKRLVIDFRQLNAITEVLPSMLPTFDELVLNLKGKYISTLDLKSAYHHIRLDPLTAPATVFKTPFGFFQFNVLAFGMTNAPELFQRMVAELLFPHHEIL